MSAAHEDWTFWRVDPRLPQSAHEQIYQQVRVAILAGHWPPGATLPPVRDLAARLGVHFNTVARVYRRLAREGWVTTRPGRGTVVQASDPGSDWRAAALEDLARRYAARARWLGYSPAAALAAVARALQRETALPRGDATRPDAPDPDQG